MKWDCSETNHSHTCAAAKIGDSNIIFMFKVDGTFKGDRRRSERGEKEGGKGESQQDFVDVLLEVQKNERRGFVLDAISIQAIILVSFLF